MAKYRFRLESIQKIRELERDQHRARLADAFRAEDVLNEQDAELDDQLSQLAQWKRSAVEGTTYDINVLQAAARYEPVLKSQQQLLATQRQLLDQEIERRRQAVVESDRGVRALELLDGRRREEHRQDELRTEMKQNDEVANTRQWRQMN
jgi:flagellar export protein FliJ